MSGTVFIQDVNQRATAARAARQAGSATAAVRWSFIGRSDENVGDAVPMARMLRGSGGRGGATRLKLYLSFLWLARGRDKPVFGYPAQQLAALLGLPTPDVAGARRIQDALKWLHDQRFVALDRRPGEVTRVHLLDDAGSGTPYRDPGTLTTRQPKRPQLAREPHFYVRLDRELWTEGWIAELSGAGIAMYLAALREQRGRDSEPIWISPRIGREQYDLSDETRNKGLRELVDHGLLELERQAVPQTSFDERYRARNVYRVAPGGFRSPGDPFGTPRRISRRPSRPPSSDSLA